MCGPTVYQCAKLYVLDSHLETVIWRVTVAVVQVVFIVGAILHNGSLREVGSCSRSTEIGSQSNMLTGSIMENVALQQVLLREFRCASFTARVSLRQVSLQQISLRQVSHSVCKTLVITLRLFPCRRLNQSRRTWRNKRCRVRIRRSECFKKRSRKALFSLDKNWQQVKFTSGVISCTFLTFNKYECHPQ